MLVFFNMAYSQVENNKKEVLFTYNNNVYEKIAKDSIKVLYDRQKTYYTKNESEIDKAFYNYAISLNYNYEDLDYIIIPKYRLERDAERKYSCKSNIENFIVFNESCKYFRAIIDVKDKIIGDVSVPNFIFEFQRIYTPDVFTMSLNENRWYLREYLNRFVVYENTNYDFIKTKKSNFFFELYGLNDVVFEIDKETGLLYANYFGFYTNFTSSGRILANDFIRKYLGEKIIIALAKGDYKDIDDGGSIIEYKSCPEENYDSDNIVMRVIYQ